MTDYADLIQRLISEANDTKYMLGHASSLHTAAADAIKELVAERDRLLLEADPELPTIAYLVGAHDWKVRAEKAEADLAAARKALRDVVIFNGLFDHADWTQLHGPAIAAARAEKGETKAPAWPSGCRNKSSCARNGECMYMKCQHQGRDIKGEIAAARAEGGKND